MTTALFALESLASVRTGDGAPQEATSFGSTGIPFIRAGSLINLLGGLDESELEHIPLLEVKKRRMQKFPAGTIVFAKSGMSCTKGHVYELKSECCVVNHLAAIECGPNLDSRFLLRWLERNPPSRLIANPSYPSIKISDIRSDKVDIPHKNGKPDLEEQKRIAAILDKADAIRRKRKQALRLTDDFLRSLFLDMFGDPVTNPKGWDEVDFGELVESTRLGMVRSSTEFGWDMPVPYVRMDAITNDGGFLHEKVQGTNATKEEIQSYGLQPGDFLFNTRNSKELVGKVAVYPGPTGATFNNNLLRIRFKKSADPYFVCFQFQFARVQRELESRKQGTTSVFAVYWKNLRTLPVLMPPIELQREFRACADKVAETRLFMDREANEAASLFSSLQQRAFRGEL